MRLIVLFLLLLLPALAGRPAHAGQPAHAQADATRTLLVQPGDTWAALAARFAVPVSVLHDANGVINPLRQPVIGLTLRVPDVPEWEGGVIRPNHASFWLTALAHRAAPSDLVAHNALATSRLDAAARLALPQAGAVPREWPAPFTAFELSHSAAVRGQALAFRGVVRADSQPISVTLQAAGGAPLPFDTFRRDHHAVGLRGIGAFYPVGPAELVVHGPDGAVWSQPWLVQDDAWDWQSLTLTGEAAQIDQAAIDAERARLFAVWSDASPDPLWRAEFAEPVTDFLYMSSGYGARRSYNGGPFRSYHEGVDFAAYAGTAVYASAAGTVVIAERLYVRGGAVIIDHGLGVYSGYYHLSEVHATPGQTVSAGDLIGAVGTTGLSTGNHLHWDLLVTETWVAADKWVAQGLGCWLLAGLGDGCAP